MMKVKYRIYLACCFFAMCLVASFSSCKTKKAPFVLQEPPIKKVEEKIVVVQVCDKFQMSYNGLPCVVYFSDDSTASYTTAIDGKVDIKVPIGEVEIKKIIFDFSSYRTQPGQLLASRDFKLATRIPSSAQSKTTTVEETFSSEVQNLFVLVR